MLYGHKKLKDYKYVYTRQEIRKRICVAILMSYKELY
jgi:hypothetical protein